MKATLQRRRTMRLFSWLTKANTPRPGACRAHYCSGPRGRKRGLSTRTSRLKSHALQMVHLSKHQVFVQFLFNGWHVRVGQSTDMV